MLNNLSIVRQKLKYTDLKSSELEKLIISVVNPALIVAVPCLHWIKLTRKTQAKNCLLIYFLKFASNWKW